MLVQGKGRMVDEEDFAANQLLDEERSRKTLQFECLLIGECKRCWNFQAEDIGERATANSVSSGVHRAMPHTVTESTESTQKS